MRTSLVIFLGYTVWEHLTLKPLAQKLQEITNGAPEMDEEEEGGLFIPFPGTIEEIQQPPYRGSDPEWQAFVKFSKDVQMQKRCKGKTQISLVYF